MDYLDDDISSVDTGAIAQDQVIRVGVDLGTNTTVLTAERNEKPLELKSDLVTSVVGFPKAGIIPGILPSDDEVLFGQDALDYRLHLDLVRPLREGYVDDLDACRLFAKHLRDQVDPDHRHELWGVVGAPCLADGVREKEIRSAVQGFLDRILIVPEPFLAAMGLREDPGFLAIDPDGDPTRHSLIVDIGAGTTDFCLVRGYFPTSDDLLSVSQAGDWIDENILAAVARRYPDVKLTEVTAREIKEAHSFVEGHERMATVKVYVDGRPRHLDFSDMIREACDDLLPVVVEGIQELLRRCDSDTAVPVMKNIIITGGGSQIRGLAEKVEATLHREEYDLARCIAPADYKRLVARGALKIAQNVRDDQWQFTV